MNGSSPEVKPHQNSCLPKPGYATSRFTLCLTTVIACLAANAAIAQSVAGCPGGKPLTLDVLTRYLASRPDEGHAIGRIEGCKIAFSLDAEALDKLGDAGASDNEMSALFRLPAPQISLEQAHAKVAELLLHIQQTGAKGIVERDQALNKFDADYLPKREQASHIAPKGQFEPTADYNKRLQQNQDAVVAMDRRHGEDRSQLSASFAKKANERQRPYTMRIAALEAATYPDFRVITYTGYDPDARQLKAVVDGDPYSFDTVPPQIAETLSKNWPKVKLFQPYTEDETRKRFLVFASISAPVQGYSARANQASLLQAKLSAARGFMSERLYNTAIAAFQSALLLAPDNAEAREGLAHATALKKKQQDFIINLPLAGAWFDQQTQLIWATKDSDHTVNWQGANDFCQSSKVAGVTGWRLATVEELLTIYSRSSPRTTKMNLMGETYAYFIKGNITLHDPLVWSGPQLGNKQGLWFTFSYGKSVSDNLNSKMGLHALCVRKYQPATDGLDAP